MNNSEILNDSCFEKYIEYVHKLTGITIQKNRKQMLIGRIGRRMHELKIDKYESYLDYIKENKEEEQLFINRVTTNETYFYRTPRIWDFITQDFLDQWYALHKNRSLTIWSAASSTGEEAHTMGVICEDFRSKNLGFNYRILGTDISTRVLDIATKGVYNGRAIERFRNTKKELFERYMKGDDELGYQVLPQIKSKIEFKPHNLFEVNKNETYDLIFLRNVLIYFTEEDQEKVIHNMHKALNPDGYLIIGESESLHRINTPFESVSPLIYQDKASKKAAA
ncbi:MAG: chemotaxis protein CheR [Bdellovibrionaceae bacterium]|nr:chemotaxis protein CheR [Pseudobdellovibrionaceae bacterium]